MKLRRHLAAVFAVLLLAGALAAEDLSGPEREKLLKDLESENGGVRSAAAQKIQGAGASAVAPLAKLLDTGSRSTVVSAKVALTGIGHHAARPGASSERAAVAAALVDAYGKASKGEARGILAEVMSTAGGEESVPALAAKLGDKDAREMARWALVRIPVPSAAEALRKALEVEKDPAFEIALINGLAARRDAASAPLIRHALSSPEEEVKLAAIDGLARIGDVESAGALLEALPPAGDAARARARLRVRDALVVLGERLVSAGKSETAARVYARLLESAADHTETCGALIGLARAGGEGAIDAALKALKSQDEDVRQAGLSALAVMPGNKPLRAVTALLGETSDPAARARIIGVLARRKEARAAEIAAEQLKDGDASVRAAALKALEGRDDPAVAAALLAVVRDGAPVAKEGAVGVLGRLPGQAATRAIVAAAKATMGEAKAALLLALGTRGDPSVEPVLLEEVRSEDETVRAAALEGLGTMRAADSLPVLIAALGHEGKAAVAAEMSLGRFVSQEATGKIVEAAGEKHGAARAALLRVLGDREGPAVVKALLDGARDGDEAVRVAAIEGLSGQKDPAVMPVLLEAAESGPEKVRPAAVLGCLRFGRSIEEKDKQAALSVYHKALALAPRREEKVEALQGIGRIADPSSFALVKPLLEVKDKALQREAASAILPIAVKIADQRKDEAVEVLKRAIPLAPSAAGAKAATETLRRLGVSYDIAREAGFITQWWILGPFPNIDKKMFDNDAVPIEGLRVQGGEEVKAGGATLKWKPFRTADPQGMVDLVEVLGPHDSSVAYAYAEVDAGPSDRNRVSFKIGSDDGVVCFLNGKRVHANDVNRGLSVDSDTVNLRLDPGKNRIVLKVLNASGPWAFCLRITDRQGAPLKVDQKDA